ncbi:MAG: phosphopantetheine-binding protein [Streptosporangiaceae bacterium]|jgi:acyl carrier protein
MADVLREKELIELVKNVAEEALDIDLGDATPQTPLRSLGLDSLDQLELVSALEERLETCIPDSYLNQVETVGDLIAALADLQVSRPDVSG